MTAPAPGSAAPELRGFAAARYARVMGATQTTFTRMFQSYYFFHHLGLDRHMRDRFRDHPYFRDCAEFCAQYDQNSFDPAYDTAPLDFFEPMVRRVLAAPKRSIYLETGAG